MAGECEAGERESEEMMEEHGECDVLVDHLHLHLQPSTGMAGNIE